MMFLMFDQTKKNWAKKSRKQSSGPLAVIDYDIKLFFDVLMTHQRNLWQVRKNEIWILEIAFIKCDFSERVRIFVRWKTTKAFLNRLLVNSYLPFTIFVIIVWNYRQKKLSEITPRSVILSTKFPHETALIINNLLWFVPIFFFF